MVFGDWGQDRARSFVGTRLGSREAGSDRTREASWPLRSGDIEYCSWAAELPYDTGVCGDQGKMRTRAACLPECLVDQSCLTLCDPMDCSPPGSSVHGDSPSKNTGVSCHALLRGVVPT